MYINDVHEIHNLFFKINDSAFLLITCVLKICNQVLSIQHLFVMYVDKFANSCLKLHFSAVAELIFFNK